MLMSLTVLSAPLLADREEVGLEFGEMARRAGSGIAPSTTIVVE